MRSLLVATVEITIKKEKGRIVLVIGVRAKLGDYILLKLGRTNPASINTDGQTNQSDFVERA